MKLKGEHVCDISLLLIYLTVGGIFNIATVFFIYIICALTLSAFILCPIPLEAFSNTANLPIIRQIRLSPPLIQSFPLSHVTPPLRRNAWHDDILVVEKDEEIDFKISPLCLAGVWFWPDSNISKAEERSAFADRKWGTVRKKAIISALGL